MSDERIERREAEIALLQAMYPSDIMWHEQRQELTYKPQTGGALTLRIPDDYPGYAQPLIIEALDGEKADIRNAFRDRIDHLSLSTGDEIVDAIVQAFDQVVDEHHEAAKATSDTTIATSKEAIGNARCKTVIIWLHHLLNTNKRKLALNPSGASPGEVTGVTKPGYPGILVYSGATAAVDAHVSELKNQRWQAFQVRLENVGKNPWLFSHGSDIKELESMSEVAQSILSEERRQTFLKAVGIK